MSTFQSNRTEKKSFKLDFDIFVQDQEIYGLDKLNLNCGFFDPSFVREKCAHEICEAAGLPSVRVNYAALYINDIYWGLYTLVEQVDKEFIESRFGSGEDGNLWKGDPYGSLEYLGSSESAYYDFYGLKTNEQENDWFPLVELADGLNNTQADELPDIISPLLDVNSVLVLLAVDNLLVNLDSYTGRCGNYYLYHRDLDGRFVLINWDFNESWGVFNQWGMTLDQLKQLDPYWVSSKPGQYRPLAEILWDVDVYREVYQGHLQRLMSGAVHPDTLLDRMEELRDLIRPYVYAEVPPKSIFNPLHFESAMSTDMYYPIGPPPGKFIPGLQGFIQDRHDYLSNLIGTYDPVDGIVLNELMAANDTTIADDYGDFSDWIEITNIGNDPVELSGFYLTDDMAFPFLFALPNTILEPGEYLVLWADGYPERGSEHAGFKLDSDGEDVFLLNDAVVVNQVTYSELEADQSSGRWPDGNGSWLLLNTATPGLPNDSIIPSWLDEEAGFFLSSSYPCPAVNMFSVDVNLVSDGEIEFRLFDLYGRLVRSTEKMFLFSGTNSIPFELPPLPAGLYFLHAAFHGMSRAAKIIIES